MYLKLKAASKQPMSSFVSRIHDGNEISRCLHWIHHGDKRHDFRFQKWRTDFVYKYNYNRKNVQPQFAMQSIIGGINMLNLS